MHVKFLFNDCGPRVLHGLVSTRIRKSISVSRYMCLLQRLSLWVQSCAAKTTRSQIWLDQCQLVCRGHLLHSVDRRLRLRWRWVARTACPLQRYQRYVRIVRWPVCAKTMFIYSGKPVITMDDNGTGVWANAFIIL